MISYKYSTVISALGFILNLIVNGVFFYLTLFKIKKMHGTYKRMVITFTVLGTIFSLWEIIAEPFAHNYKNSLLYFSCNTWLGSKTWLRYMLAMWSGCHTLIIWFIAMQFIYRLVCLIDTNNIKKLDGIYGYLMIIVPFVIGGFFAVMVEMLIAKDKMLDDNLSKLIFENYQLLISELSKYNITPYNFDGSVNWGNFGLLVIAVFLNSLGYLVILYCGVQMHLNMKKELAKLSISNQELQRQFFKALIAQSIGPTIFLVLPMGPFLLSPLIPGLNVNWQSGWIFCLVGAYSPFDTIMFMMIVSEYRSLLKNRVGYTVSAATPDYRTRDPATTGVQTN
ncbi:Seven TM Receptor [Caenorhabditis elegans]|uniref:Seven TM Receptor n=1 Tax=Caenorhabditis elegans TaxID=6239 RepID=P91524_CAEEL|nr:Seven TM Receptor [Caenorhabditis elegans]CCD70560.1 Seven TM Receptor [Caenorhabditis elegans]|eukprot:NP_503907.1 Seven TM Receptor [Caenorhabditis elegans]